MLFLEPEAALSITARLTGVAFAISAAEQLSIRHRAFGKAGPFSELIAQILGRGVEGAASTALAFSAALPVCLFASVAVIALGPFHIVGWLGMVMALLANWLVHRRRVVASDGAEQMAILTFVAIVLCTLPGIKPPPVMAAVWFVGGQAVLAYTTAGFAKMGSPIWRNGSALAIVLGSEAHGHEPASRILTARPGLGILMTRFVMTFECLFPLLLLGPWQLTTATLAMALLFHLGCAVLMGLNTFLWAFPATYPCVWILAAKATMLKGS